MVFFMIFIRDSRHARTYRREVKAFARHKTKPTRRIRNGNTVHLTVSP